MPTPRFSLLAAAALLVLGQAGGPTPLRAETPEEAKHREAAEEFVKVRKTGDMVNSQINRMGDMTDRISDSAAKQAGASVNPTEFAQKLRTEARDMIKKEFNWEELRPEFVQAYEQAFTEAELKEMIAFYQTPTGQKLVATEPEISGKLTKLSQEKAMAIMPRVVQHLRELVAATKPPGAPGNNPLAPPPPPGLSIPPPPPPGLSIPPPPPPGAVPNAPPTGTPPPAPSVVPMPPSATAAPSVHPAGKPESGTP